MQGGSSTLQMAEVSRLSGVSDQAIRFYERKGLIQPAGRTPKGHRLYSTDSIQSIRAIKTAQSMGFSLDEILVIFKANQVEPSSCHELRTIFEEKLEWMRNLADSLAKVQAKVVDMLTQCATCSGEECPLRTDLARHEGIRGQRRCICLGGDVSAPKNFDPKPRRSRTT